MKLILSQEEIFKALRDYAINSGLALNNKHIEVTLTAGRKDNGVSATLDITDNADASYTSTDVQTRVCSDNSKPEADVQPKVMVDISAVKAAAEESARKAVEAESGVPTTSEQPAKTNSLFPQTEE